MAARPRLSLITTLVCAGVLAAVAPTASAQTATPDSQVSSDWDSLIKDAIPQQTPSTVLTQKATAPVSPGDDFLNHFYFDTRTEYTRADYYFSGQPTATGVIDAPLNGSFNPNGIPYPDAFQPSANTMYSYASLGTRGLWSERVNTNFAIRYDSDLTTLLPGSPNQGIVDAFPGAHLFQITSGNVEVNGKASDGWFADSSVKFGRQSISGEFPVDFDGASFTRHRSRYDVTFFAGRRFTYFSDPGPRAIGGMDLSFRLTDKIKVGYESLFYINTNNTFTYQQHITDNLLLNGYFRMVDRHPVDLSVTTFWSPQNGKMTITAAFFAKLSDWDYVYDYALPAADYSSYNTLPRLYLGVLQPYTQGSIDVRRSITSYLRLGGGVTVRRLNDTLDQGPFDTSFQDYRVNAQVNTWGRTETTVEYHERDANRLPSDDVTDFGDPTLTGETKVQDLSVELGRSFAENRFSLQGGGFVRRINYQTTYFTIGNAQDKGWLGSASYRLDSRTRLYMDYSLDTDFFVWRPSIKNGQVFRLGVDWKY